MRSFRLATASRPSPPRTRTSSGRFFPSWREPSLLVSRRRMHVGEEIEEHGEHGVDREELEPLDPVALAVAADLLDDDDLGHDRDHLRYGELKVHRTAEEVGGEDEHRGHE